MEFFEEHKKQIMLATIAILIVVIFITYGRKTKATFVESALGFVITPVQELTTNVGNWFGSKIDWVRNKDNLAAENEQLKEQIALLETENKRLRRYGTENQRLSELLKISQKYADYNTIPAYVINRDVSNFSSDLVINVGENDGVAVNMTVIADKGLVGHIISTTPTTAKVQVIVDAASTVSCNISTTEESIICKGTLENSQILRASYIPTGAELIQGDNVYTSGLGEIFRKGILIGTIEEIITTRNVTDRYATIKPAVDFSTVDTVLVINN